jgi:hypothetical protein
VTGVSRGRVEQAVPVPAAQREAIARAVATGIGIKDAYGTDWGLSHGERARCYAAADAVLGVVGAWITEARRDEREALLSLRAAWNAHMAVCPGRPDLPTQEQLEAWRNAPSNTVSGGTEPVQPTDSGQAS